MDKDLLDARIGEVKAQNDTRFIEVLASIDNLKVDIDSKPSPPSIWQFATLLVAVVGIVFGILAFVGNRFDSGMSVSGVIDETANRLLEVQIARDADQDARLGAFDAQLGQILDAIELNTDQIRSLVANQSE
ncbi:MAG: hypothetical protein NXH97_18215 [Rhodobacteraceae bacterium]|nr:hypothetical protein [Paracoccaceae bacterium]